MAREYKNPSIVSGKSIQDILNMGAREFNELSESELRKVVGRLVSAGNKRIRSFESAGERSPALRLVEESGGKFSTQGKGLNALRAEFSRAKNFLQSRTGTRGGWTEVKKETVESLGKAGVNITVEQFDEFWESYEELKELSPEVAARGLKYTVLRDISDMVTEGEDSPDEIAVKIHEKIAEIYEERAEIEKDVDGVSGFFEL